MNEGCTSFSVANGRVYDFPKTCYFGLLVREKEKKKREVRSG